MSCTGDSLVQGLHAELAQVLADQPPHLARDVSNVDVGAGVERVREDVDLVALVDEFLACGLVDVGCQHADRPVAEGDQVALVAMRPTEYVADRGGLGDVVQRSVPTGNEDGEVWSVGGEALAPHVLEVERAADLLLVLFVDALDSLVLLRERPHLELDRVAGDGGDVDVEAGGVEVDHREEHLDWVVARGEEPAVGHL